MKIEFTLNGINKVIETDPREDLLHILRENFQLRGTKYGCGEGECGACTVLLNGKAVTSCLVMAGQIHGGEIVTIEGMEDDPLGKHIITAFVELGAIQCGFCTPAMIISSWSLLAQTKNPDFEEINHALGGNLCRCTGYTKIIDAVRFAGKAASNITSTDRGTGEIAVAFKTAEYARPESLDEALMLLSENKHWQIVSGFTDYGVRNTYRLKDKSILDLSFIPKLKAIEERDDFVVLGGGVTFSDLLEHSIIEQWAKPLHQAAAHIGALQIQNRATLAGNLINASPAADSVPPLYVLEALILLCSTRGFRIVPVKDLATGPGQTVIAPDEILVEVQIPKRKGKGQEVAFFSKFGARNRQTISMASVALRSWKNHGHLEDVKIALGAVAPTVIFAARSAEILMDGALTEDKVMEAGRLAAEDCSPIDDIRASANYRRHLIRGLMVKNLWQYMD